MGEIEKVSKKTLKRPKLHGWGNNSFGQLALNTGNAVVGNPTEILLPELAKDDHIKDIECGSKTSVLLTFQGNLWITEPLEKKIVKEEDQTKHNHSSKKSKKESLDLLKDKELHKGLSKWLNLTPKCEKLK